MNVLWGRVVVLGVVLLLVFLLGRATGGDSSELQALQERLEDREAEIDALEAENRALASPSPDPDAQAGAEGTEGTDPAEGTGTTGGTGTTTTPTATPTATATASPTATPTGSSTEAQNYTVRSGDTLSGISNRFYGSSSFAKCIQTANQIADAGVLQVGKSLTIPPKPAQPCT